MLTDSEHTVIEEAKCFANEIIAGQAQQWEQAGRIPAHVYHDAAQRGLCRLIVPKSLGGLGLSVTAMAHVMQALASQCFASAFSLVVHNNLTARVALSASPKVRDHYLPDLMTGKHIGAFLLTEPEIGSDAGAIQTQAQKTTDGWCLNGSKAWVSNAGHANTLSVYAQTDISLGTKGIACFVLDVDTPGIARESNYALLGGHALATAGFTFSKVCVPDDAMLVAPGEGFRLAMTGIDLARINVAAMCCGMLEHALDLAIDYVQERKAFGQTIADFQGVQWMLADSATDLEAARLLAFNAAAISDAGEPAGLASAHAKKFATRVALKRLADCMQVMGAHGLSTEHAMPRHFAAAKIAQYLDGATEIQNVVISRALLKARK